MLPTCLIKHCILFPDVSQIPTLTYSCPLKLTVFEQCGEEEPSLKNKTIQYIADYVYQSLTLNHKNERSILLLALNAPSDSFLDLFNGTRQPCTFSDKAYMEFATNMRNVYVAATVPMLGTSTKVNDDRTSPNDFSSMQWECAYV